MKECNPNILITLENPAQSSFLQCPIVQLRLVEEQYIVRKGDHCAGATEELDGVVFGSRANRQGGLMPQKPTIFACINVEEQMHLLQCHIDGCRMKVPGTGYHVLAITSTAYKKKYGQRRVKPDQKAKIPLGVHERIFRSHIRQLYKGTTNRHSSRCAQCGQTGNLMRCTTTECRRAQHRAHSVCKEPQEHWKCDSCYYLMGHEN